MEFPSMTSSHLSLPLEEVRDRFEECVAGVTAPEGEPLLVTVDGKPVAALISVAEYEELLRRKYREEFHAIFDELDDVNKELLDK